jgi:hypothetical protein
LFGLDDPLWVACGLSPRQDEKSLGHQTPHNRVGLFSVRKPLDPGRKTQDATYALEALQKLASFTKILAQQGS